MGKLNENKELSKQKLSDEKKEKYYRSMKHKYENGSMRKEEIPKLTHERLILYLEQELQKKYPKYQEKVNVRCHHCAVSLLYDDGYITYEELLKIPGTKHK